MMISTKGRNALRIMIDLAQHQDDGNIPLRDIATRQNASLKYLEAIAGKLSKKELITARHGKNGGYRLNRPVENYTVGDILRLTEGDLSPVSCDAQCDRNCPSRSMWTKLGKMIDDFFDGITLKQLMEQE